MDRTVNVDFITGQGAALGATGDVATKLLANNMNVSALRTNDVLYNRDWILVDKTILEVSRQRLVAVADLFANGLTYPIADAMGVTRVEWEKVSDFGVAETNMSGVTEGQSDRVQYSMDAVPLPIVHKDFNINIRALTASRRAGHPLDVTQVGLATRIVTEKVESILFNGGLDTGAPSGKVYGYTTAPNKLNGALAHNWTDATTTGAEMLADLLAIFAALYAKNMYGPYMIYVPNTAYINMGADFKDLGAQTILQRLLAMPGVKGIKPTSNLTGATSAPGIVVVQMTSDVVDMVDGIQPQAVQWTTHGGMVVNFKVLAILVPRMKSTYSNQSGIAVYTNP